MILLLGNQLVKLQLHLKGMQQKRKRMGLGL